MSFASTVLDQKVEDLCAAVRKSDFDEVRSQISKLVYMGLDGSADAYDLVAEQLRRLARA